MEVRRFERRDAEACCRVINASILTMDGLNDAAQQFVIASNVPGVLGPALANYFTVVCETQDGIAGVGALDGSEIKRLYVAPPAQNRGVGKALLGKLEDEALARGLGVLWLEASPSSVAFYEAAGFQVVRAYTFSRGDAQFSVVKMDKRLARAAG